MSKNPILNALGATGYILLIATVFNLISKFQGSKPDTFFAPVGFLSLLTLSVAVMSYLFFYQPVQLFLDNKKKEATRLFIQTLGSFGVITLIVWGLLFSGLI